MRRSRPLTAHQLEVQKNRKQRVDYILSRGLRKKHHYARKKRKEDGVIWQRTMQMVNPFDDSEGEDNMFRGNPPFKACGFGGLVHLEVEDDDFGEEMSAYATAFRRMGRRLDRWDSQKDLNLGVISTNRVSQTKLAQVNGEDTVKDSDETEEETSPKESKPRAGRGFYIKDEKDLDDVDREMLGVSDAEADGDEDLDDIDDEALEPLQNSDYSTRVMEIVRPRGEQASSQVDR